MCTHPPLSTTAQEASVSSFSVILRTFSRLPDLRYTTDTFRLLNMEHMNEIIIKINVCPEMYKP